MLAAGVAAAALAGAPAAHAAPNAAARLAAVAHHAPNRQVVAIVQFDASASEAQARALARRHGARVMTRLPLIHGLSLRLPAAQATRLAHAHAVKGVTLNSRVKPQAVSAANLVTSYPKTVAADKLWSLPTPVTGKGVGVAVIDTGVASELPDFRSADGSSRVVANVVTNPAAITPADGYGHGTHVAGIIAGNGANRSAGDPLAGQYIGVAPEANVIAVKASDEAGNASLLDVINGLQFVVEHKDDYNIRVVNLSLSSDAPQSYKTDPLDAAVESAWMHGIVVVAAAGNRGSAADAADYAPANDPYVITVGATDEQGDKDWRNDTLAPYSSAGTTQDGFAKPDVLAPGARIVAPLATGSAFTALCPACVIGGTYIRASGTSMAAPMVAGAVALMLQAHPEWSPDQVKGILAKTGRPISGVTGVSLAADKAVAPGPAGTATANRGLAPSGLINTATGDIDYTKSSWSKSSWSKSSWSAADGTTIATWTCACAASGASVDPTKSSWSNSSWSSRLEP
jgi:serine protease AprX